jgi:hypothetical protein
MWATRCVSWPIGVWLSAQLERIASGSGEFYPHCLGLGELAHGFVAALSSDSAGPGTAERHRGGELFLQAAL